MSRRLLAVLAHPDDETFLMGGTLALLVDRGWQVFLLTATDGERGRRGPYEGDALSAEAFGVLRREELEAACRALGVRALPGVGCPDGEVSACSARLKGTLRAWLGRIRPHIVVTFGPDGVSGHTDHVAVGRVTRAAVRDYRASVQPPGPRPELLFVLASGSLPECCLRGASDLEPTETLRVGVAATAGRKLQAIAAYRSQEHLQPRDAAHRRRIQESPERFHRVRWADAGSPVSPGELLYRRRRHGSEDGGGPDRRGHPTLPREASLRRRAPRNPRVGSQGNRTGTTTQQNREDSTWTCIQTAHSSTRSCPGPA